MLSALGLSPLEERLYNAVLENQRGSAAVFSRRLDVPQHQVRDLLSGLEERGLISRNGTRPPRYTAASPRVALGLLVLRKQEELEQARRAVEQLTERFESEAQRVSSFELIEIITGQHIVVERINEALRKTEREVIGFGKAPSWSPPDEFLQIKLGLLRRGVKCRGVYEREALQEPGLLAYLERVAAAGELSRIVGELPMRLTLIDRSCALTPLEVDRWDEWLLVRSPPLINALVMVFETMWKSASPMPFGERDPRRQLTPVLSAEEDQRMLALMASGMQDAAVARQMGVGVRTVVRRVGQIMEELSANTRFQGGWMARDRFGPIEPAAATKPHGARKHR